MEPLPWQERYRAQDAVVVERRRQGSGCVRTTCRTVVDAFVPPSLCVQYTEIWFKLGSSGS